MFRTDSTFTPLILLISTLLPAHAQDLPLKPGSVRFAVIGDAGTGGKEQYELAQVMERYREKVNFNFVVMLGDNIYGGESADGMKRKFELPYKALLDAGVRFYASLGNHDNPNERFYKFFNMGEKRYYSFKKGNVEFFALDSNYMDPQQLDWIKTSLRDSTAAWKIPYFHHPLYSDSKYHGPDTDLRARLEPLFAAGGVNVVLSGHEHVYERLKPHGGIYYFVLGNSGELRPHDLRRSSDTAKGFDTDRDFMMMEVAGDQLYFQTISRTGETVDSGTIQKQPRAAAIGADPAR
jgi:3',5'-cyclic AMP phosphodiesterase CpdA